jgi:hypothetical protein
MTIPCPSGEMIVQMDDSAVWTLSNATYEPQEIPVVSKTFSRKCHRLRLDTARILADIKKTLRITDETTLDSAPAMRRIER